MKTLITLFTAALLCSSAVAQEKSEVKKKKSAAPTASGPAMPKPAAEMKDLRALVGTWSTEETFEQTPMMPAGTATGTNTVRLGPGGFTVLMEEHSKGNLGAFSGHGVLTWDPNESLQNVLERFNDAGSDYFDRTQRRREYRIHRRGHDGWKEDVHA
jgi:hypothetical protein